MKVLAALGCGFDCASQAEIKAALDTGVSASSIIYANTVKGVDHLKYALSTGVSMMTFDSEYELEKIKKYYPGASLVLRIKADDSHSHYQFSTKFGCSVSEAKVCLEKAKELDLKVIGVSFHVGSKCGKAEVYGSTIKDAREVFSIVETLGMKLTLLDIEGGFPRAREDIKLLFADMAKVINESIDKYFGSLEDLEIIAESGRYVVDTPHTLILNVIGKRRIIKDESEPHFQYYINDTTYGAFINVPYEGLRPKWNFMEEKSSKLYKSTMFGQTCDSSDVIAKDEELPELHMGDWCYVENFGAYTQSTICNFNGFPLAKCAYIYRK